MTAQNNTATGIASHGPEETAQYSRLARCLIAGTALGAAGYLGSSFFIATLKPRPINVISGLSGVLCGTLLGDMNLHSPTYEEQAEYALFKEGKYPSENSYHEDKKRYVNRLKEQDQMSSWLMLNAMLYR